MPETTPFILQNHDFAAVPVAFMTILYLLSVARASVQEVISEAELAVEYSFNAQPIPLGVEADNEPPERVRPLPTLISSTAPVDAVERPSILAVAIVRPLHVAEPALTRFVHSTATTPAETRERVVSEACQSSIVVN